MRPSGEVDESTVPLKQARALRKLAEADRSDRRQRAQLEELSVQDVDGVRERKRAYACLW